MSIRRLTTAQRPPQSASASPAVFNRRQPRRPPGSRRARARGPTDRQRSAVYAAAAAERVCRRPKATSENYRDTADVSSGKNKPAALQLAESEPTAPALSVLRRLPSTSHSSDSRSRTSNCCSEAKRDLYEPARDSRVGAHFPAHLSSQVARSEPEVGSVALSARARRGRVRSLAGIDQAETVVVGSEAVPSWPRRRSNRIRATRPPSGRHAVAAQSPPSAATLPPRAESASGHRTSGTGHQPPPTRWCWRGYGAEVR